MKLGSAFQKINFLRDLKDDYSTLGRTYFPNIDLVKFDNKAKAEIEKDIEIDFMIGYEGIKRLPVQSRLGVYIAFVFYKALFNKIKKIDADVILKNRVLILFGKTMVKPLNKSQGCGGCAFNFFRIRIQQFF